MVTLALSAISACTLGSFESKSAAVVLLPEADVMQCKFIDTVTHKSSDRWAPSRTDVKITNELLTLARKDAFALGGNTVVKKSAIALGRQTFSVYNCS